MYYFDRGENEAKVKGAVEGIIRNSSLERFIEMWNTANSLYGEDPNETDENIIYRREDFAQVMADKGYGYDAARAMVNTSKGDSLERFFTVSDAHEIKFFGANDVMTEARIGALIEYVTGFERDCGEPLFDAILECVYEGRDK